MKKVLIRGPILTRTGYGEQARFAYRALKSRPDLFDVYVIPTAWGQTGWMIEDTEERHELDEKITSTNRHLQYCQQVGAVPFDITVQVTIPQEWEQIAPVNVGFTAGTETTHISHKWVQASNKIDRIVVVSEHAKSAFKASEYHGQSQSGESVTHACTTPVDVVGFPVKNTETTPVEFETDTSFNFLSVAQWSPRKNLENTVAWFIEEFRDNEDVGLIIKANIARNCLVDRNLIESRLKELKENLGEHKCKLYLLHGNLTDEEMVGLYRQDNVHALVNLAHGEGFGLPMFEAACNALPIVAPHWGGQLDYMNAEVTTKSKGKKKTRTRFLGAKVDYNIAKIQDAAVWPDVLIPESSWCYPQEKSYKRALREVYKNYTRFKGQANKLQASVAENFSEENQNQKFVDSIMTAADSLVSNLPTEVVTL